MSKKHFELIAAVLREYNERPGVTDAEKAQLSELAKTFATELRAENPRFDRSRFIAACEGRDSTDSAGRKVRYSNGR
jgi:hypothetical protein